jgi:hypothetical protein
MQGSMQYAVDSTVLFTFAVLLNLVVITIALSTLTTMLHFVRLKYLLSVTIARRMFVKLKQQNMTSTTLA